MKKIIKIFILAVTTTFILQAQNNIWYSIPISETAYRCSLSTAVTIDTAIIKIENPHKRLIDTYTMRAISSGVDTLSIFTNSIFDTTKWSQVGLRGYHDDTVRTTLITSTTRREYQLLDPEPYQIMVVTPSADGSIPILTFCGKRKFK